MEIIRANEEAYLNELVAYQLQFDGYIYDWLTGKLCEVHVTTFIKKIICVGNDYNYKFLEWIYCHYHWGTKAIQRVKLTIVSCILFLPIELVEMLVTPKRVP